MSASRVFVLIPAAFEADRGPNANERRDAAVAETAADLGITDPEQLRALAHAYEVAREYTRR